MNVARRARVLAVALIFLAPSSATAQRSIALELRAGAALPTTELGRTALLESVGFMDFGEPGRTAVVGAALHVQLSDAWGARLRLDRALEADVRGQWRCAPFVACPDVLIVVGGGLRRWSVAADAVFRPPVAGARLRPALFAGVGVRRQSLAWDEPLADVRIPRRFAETDPVLRLGAEVAVRLASVEPLLELHAAVTPFGAAEERFPEGVVPGRRITSVDIGAGVGLRIRLR